MLIGMSGAYPERLSNAFGRTADPTGETAARLISRRAAKKDVRDGAPPVEADAAAQAEVDFSTRRLLLVEDNQINMEIARMILTQAGFTVESAENGRVAVDMVAASGPGYYDAILMDIQMPVMDGCEAARAIRAMQDRKLAGIPILALTANTFKEDVEAQMEAGMVAHIAKPVDVQRMLATLKDVLAENQ